MIEMAVISVTTAVTRIATVNEATAIVIAAGIVRAIVASETILGRGRGPASAVENENDPVRGAVRGHVLDVGRVHVNVSVMEVATGVIVAGAEVETGDASQETQVCLLST